MENGQVVVQPYVGKSASGNPEYILRFWDTDSRVYLQVVAYVAYDTFDHKYYTFSVNMLLKKQLQAENLYNPSIEELEKVLPVMKKVQKWADKLQPKSFVDWLTVIKKAYGVKSLCSYSSSRYDAIPNDEVIERDARDIDRQFKERLAEVAKSQEDFAQALQDILLYMA